MHARGQPDIADITMNGATQQKLRLTLVVAFVALERAVELWPLLQDPAVLEVKIKGLRRGLHGR